jgi:putative glycosyltransferase (TIGR04372 family)
MPIHFRVLSYIGKVTRTVILVPHPIAIGNYAEEIYFGLLKARRESKKLLILQPYPLFGYLQLKLHNNRTLLSLRSKYRSTFQDSLFFPAACWFITIYFGFFRAISIVLEKFFAKRLPERYIIPMMGQETLWQPEGDAVEFSWDVVREYKWAEQINTPLHLELSEDQLKESNLLRSKMGLPKDAWFVCLHVRDGGYYGDHLQAENRNANILNYIPAIREVTSRGGWVVRMGDSSMPKLPSMDKVIDYPFSSSKCALMDIYLIKECRFYLGMQSGILDIAMLFQRPILTTNMVTWLITFPLKPNDMGAFKNVYSKVYSRFLYPHEWPATKWGGHSNFGSPEKYQFHENSPEELRDFVVEFFDRKSNWEPSPEQLNFSQIRINEGKKLLSAVLISEDFSDDLTSRYRLASRLESSQGCLCSKSLNAQVSTRGAMDNS